MPQGQGHIANTTFAPKGAWQSDVSASEKCLGYDAFGSLLPGRNYSSGSYRYLFQGQEHDDEINDGVGTSYAFDYRMQDPRIGRFYSIDPLAGKYPYLSPYSFSGNRLIDAFELEGLEPNPLNYITEGFRRYFNAISKWFDFKLSLPMKTKTITPYKSFSYTSTSENSVDIVFDFSGLFEGGKNMNKKVEKRLQGIAKIEIKKSEYGLITYTVQVKKGMPVNVTFEAKRNSNGQTEATSGVSVGARSDFGGLDAYVKGVVGNDSRPLKFGAGVEIPITLILEGAISGGSQSPYGRGEEMPKFEQKVITIGAEIEINFGPKPVIK
jgi:RHS repeat-associated protein